MKVTLEKELVAKIHAQVNATMEVTARAHGFVYEGKRWTYDPVNGTIRGKFKFTLAANVTAIANELAAKFGYKVRVGDKVELRGVKYKVDDITSKGKVVIMSESGKTYTVREPKYLVPMK